MAHHPHMLLSAVFNSPDLEMKRENGISEKEKRSTEDRKSVV